jgi:hypothetical protein
VTCFLLFCLVLPGQAQERDTTKTEIRIRQLPRPAPLHLHGHSERSFNNLALPSTGIYGKPDETKYYQPPFKGQYYLDLAVEAYREEIKDDLGLNWLFRFIKMMAPYVNNRFEFGVYKIEDLPIVDRDNPLTKPQNVDERDKNR